MSDPKFDRQLFGNKNFGIEASKFYNITEAETNATDFPKQVEFLGRISPIHYSKDKAVDIYASTKHIKWYHNLLVDEYNETISNNSNSCNKNRAIKGLSKRLTEEDKQDILEQFVQIHLLRQLIESPDEMVSSLVKEKMKYSISNNDYEKLVTLDGESNNITNQDIERAGNTLRMSLLHDTELSNPNELNIKELPRQMKKYEE